MDKLSLGIVVARMYQVKTGWKEGVEDCFN